MLSQPLIPGIPAHSRGHKGQPLVPNPAVANHQPPHHLEKDSASPCPWHMSAMSTGSSVPLARTPGVISMSSSTASTELPLFHPLVVTPVAPACRASPKLRKLPRPPSPVVVASDPSPRLPSLWVSQVPWMPTHDRVSGRNMTKPPVRGHAQVNRTREVAHPLPSRRPCLLSYCPVMVDECVRPKPKTAMVSQYQSPIRTRPAIITPSALRRRKQYLSNRCLFPFFVVPTICTAPPPSSHPTSSWRAEQWMRGVGQTGMRHEACARTMEHTTTTTTTNCNFLTSMTSYMLHACGDEAPRQGTIQVL